MGKSIFLAVLSFLLAHNFIAAQNNAVLPEKLKTSIVLKTQAGVTAQANGIKCGTILVEIDTTVTVSPKYAYLSIDFTEVEGTNQLEVMMGNNIVWIFDKTGKEIVVKERFLKRTNAAMGANMVKMLVKIPYRLKTDNNPYTIHYRWETKDKSKNLDLITTK